MSTATTLPDWRRVANYQRQRRRRFLTPAQERRAAKKVARAAVRAERLVTS